MTKVDALFYTVGIVQNHLPTRLQSQRIFETISIGNIKSRSREILPNSKRIYKNVLIDSTLMQILLVAQMRSIVKSCEMPYIFLSLMKL